MKGRGKLADRRLAIAQIGRHPAAAEPGISEPWVERQSALKASVGFLETTRQHQCAAAEGNRQGVVWRKLIGFVGQLQRQGPVAIGSRTEAVRGPLSPAPSCHGLW